MGKNRREMKRIHGKKTRIRKAKVKRQIEEGKKRKRDRPKSAEKPAKAASKKSAESHEPKSEAAASDGG
jgi:hypothetical protein